MTMKNKTKKKAEHYAPPEYSIEERKKDNYGRYRLNRAKCLLCKQVMVSTHRHDFVTCECGNLSVEGGSWYLKRCFTNPDSWKDMSVLFQSAKKEIENDIR